VKDRLIIFARYPEPGKVKTRLIPALGEEGAALLYRDLAERTLQTGLQLAEEREVALQVSFCGGDIADMEAWLGSDPEYTCQVEGDLGKRMAKAFQEAFAGKVDRVVMVGTDCPDLSEKVLQQAFNALNTVDMVVGPAEDGGYYLIGLSSEASELFRGVSWGTETVFQQTMAIAEQAGLSCFLLSTLADVDRPEDLVQRPDLLTNP